MSTKIIISGGGTGGHIYPAVAIANALRELEPGIELLFVGAEGKMEMEKVPKAGYAIVGLPIVGIQRQWTLANLAFPYKLIKSLNKARKVIKDFRPSVAVGVGGFASGPLLLVASAMGIPTLIQEQNSYAGITNKVLSKWAKKICVAYPNMERFFPKEKILFFGNPVRSDIINIDQKREAAAQHFGLKADKQTLLIIGGSLGARSINRSLLQGLQRLADAGYQVIWQTGKDFDGQAQEALQGLKCPGIQSYPFIYEMDLAYAMANVVISRAGALSVSELCLAEKPAILVPYPFASEDHQTQNALSLVEQKAAIMVKDEQAGERLLDTAIELLHNEPLQRELSHNIRSFAQPQAAACIAKEILALVHSKKSKTES
ncbi:UDP-N-acetylglucosamine--N-acetylmuramyl-(pentapeptide) pyrophosphoryl-undecaprenol N-acetylglucosamine transferase [Dyadobacter jejuensis]|uniref:UDP-N-acetylglucosamine--N-acetylmuramyl-(pentapeptide) pyrophosphoryl-undecaprenol N-acetylglucosamine transferase n=1 Tax=Dyadobacter jejuensis TaxID=1082580 RepID=A0A316ATY1_9BACT|nr:undecaprenyldiphospho-muramoylpentapeptide beta-N-acetylglucosaminyltransferase [Dyadobacter jejuensis]PWJ60140.1 UDP-N-acetylglucosamine--N-acetylmuramyl-(pentapeptide) pyrophosphoryl-undecaprenol N-acetylglucosamine transferase [Dyadobacter jejuensis]